MHYVKERSISLLDLIKILWQKIIHILLAFLLGFVISIISFPFSVTPKYTATGNFIINKSLSRELQVAASELVDSEAVIELALDDLYENGITNCNGTSIDNKYVLEGISAFYNDYSPTIIVEFTSRNSIYNQEIVNSIIDSAIEYGNSEISIFTNSLTIGEYSQNSIYTGTTKVVYYSIGTIFAGIIAITLILLLSISKGKIIFENDYSNLGIPFYKFSQKLDGKTKQIQFKKMFNEIEGFFRKTHIKTIGLINPSVTTTLTELFNEIIAYTMLENKKIAVIVFDNQSEKNLKNRFLTSETSIIDDTDVNKNLYSMTTISENFSLISFSKFNSEARLLKTIDLSSIFRRLTKTNDLLFLMLNNNENESTYLITLDDLDLLFVGIEVNSTRIVDFKNILVNINKEQFEKAFLGVLDNNCKTNPFRSLFLKIKKTFERKNNRKTKL